ncbi:potassium channel family protein, partial [Rickettsiales bacterium]|nr:potassium channel family protein [Rickettsiales bacterium]
MLIGFKKFNFFSRKVKNSPIKSQLCKMLFVLFGIIILHSLLMMYFEKLHFFDAFWLTITTVTTVGYGDLSSKSNEGRVVTIILIYFIGIAVVAQTASLYFEYRQEIRNKILTGNWNWKMKDHIVFLNCSKEITEEYFYEAVTGLRNSHADFAKLPIIIVSTYFNNGLSEKLRKLNVHLVNQDISSDDFIEGTNLKEASIIVTFAYSSLRGSSDSINFELIDRIRNLGIKSRIISEVVKDKNRERLIKIGADNTLRPIRTYPELLMRAILTPGSEQVIETLFNSSGEECIRYNIESNLKWIDVINILAQNNLGVPIAYQAIDGKIINNPCSSDIIDFKAIFIIINKNNIKK